MRVLPDPRSLAEYAEIDPQVPRGAGDRFSGYGVMGMPFASGHVLALRRFPASSLGYGYSSVWLRDPADRWTFWSDVPPEDSCARFFGRAIHRVEVSAIRIRWHGPYRLAVMVEEADLEWQVTLGASPATIAVNAFVRLLPERVWEEPRALRRIGAVASRVLRTGQLSLVGRAPNGHEFKAAPRKVWRVRAATARLGSLRFGEPAPLARQARLGDFIIPQHGLFVIARSRMEALPPAAAPGTLSGPLSAAPV